MLVTVHGRGPCWYCSQGLHDFCPDNSDCRCMHGQMLASMDVIVAETFWRNEIEGLELRLGGRAPGLYLDGKRLA